ncbi:MAG TPA: hypothetical protein VEW42_04000 [Candidatus Eisenbacteria bacterium]|nr:hypothetical protein [Candidatus Eisenbacteria bacterium]
MISVLSATAFAASRAAFSSQVTLAANTFSTGTVDLQISKSTSSAPTAFTDVSIAGFTGNILPGATVSQTVWLKNTSDAVDFLIAAQAASVSGAIAPADVTVTLTPVSNDGLTNTGSPVIGTLSDWESVLSLGSTIAHGAKQRYKMDVSLSGSVTTTGSISFDFVFTGTQTP